MIPHSKTLCPVIKARGYHLVKGKPKKNQRSRLQWEHMAPASSFGNSFYAWAGWRDIPQCRGLRTRKCARSAENTFQLMEGDLYNLFPSVGGGNQDRSNVPMGIPKAHGNYKTKSFVGCNIQVHRRSIRISDPSNPKKKKSQQVGVTEPKSDWLKGLAARAYLYMHCTYPEHSPLQRYHWEKKKTDQGLKLTKYITYKLEDLQTYKQWHENHPVSQDECDIYELYKAQQGNPHILLEPACKHLTQSLQTASN